MTAYEQLWTRLDEVSAQLRQLTEERDRLFHERAVFARTPTPPWKIQEIESAYWAAEGSIRSLEGLEATIIEALTRLDRDEDVPNLANLLPSEENRAERTLSKRRLAMTRDEQFSPKAADFILDPFFARFEPDLRRPPETRILTTGRHARRLKGNFAGDPLAVAVMFFEATHDTHGGKARKGAKYQGGTAYLTKGGKAIRKR